MLQKFVQNVKPWHALRSLVLQKTIFKQLLRSCLKTIQHNADVDGEILTFKSTSLRLSETLRSQYPEIEYVVVTDWFSSHGLMTGNKKLVGGNFLKMFQHPLLQGNANTVLNDIVRASCQLFFARFRKIRLCLHSCAVDICPVSFLAETF